MGMQEIEVGSRHKINLDTWERRASFHFFKSFTEPYHGVCLRVDCTATYSYAKQHHLSVFLSLLHRSLVAAHQVENFKTRIVGGDVWSYEQIHAGSAVGRENGTIGLGHYQFRPRIDEFVHEAAVELDRVRQRDDMERYPEANLIRYSVLPWFDFTSISHARDFSHEDSAPRITFGKITKADGRSDDSHLRPADFAIFDRKELKLARSSSEQNAGCSQAVKCPPLGSLCSELAPWCEVRLLSVSSAIDRMRSV
jgi:chloramphenicol O-acetyltransferase type A